MQKTKQITTLLLTVTMLCGGLTACGKNSGGGVSMVDRPAGQEKEETKIVEEELTEAEVAQESSSTVEEEKKINYTRFEDLSLAAEQVGFSFRAIEETADAYFSSFSIIEEQDEDEEGNAVGNPYPVVTLQYKSKATKLPAFKVTVYPVQGEIELPPTYVLTEEIEGVSVFLTDYIIMLVLPDYELTEEDWEFVNSGKGSFSCDGETVGEAHFRDMYWQEEGIFYHFESQIPDESQTPDLSIETIRNIVREILMAEFR